MCVNIYISVVFSEDLFPVCSLKIKTTTKTKLCMYNNLVSYSVLPACFLKKIIYNNNYHTQYQIMTYQK